MPARLELWGVAGLFGIASSGNISSSEAALAGDDCMVESPSRSDGGVRYMRRRLGAMTRDWRGEVAHLTCSRALRGYFRCGSGGKSVCDAGCSLREKATVNDIDSCRANRGPPQGSRWGPLEILATSYSRADYSFTRLDLFRIHFLYNRQKNQPLINKMPPKNTLADAWDDDWESLADVHVPLFPESNRSHRIERRREACRGAAKAETYQSATQSPTC